MNVIGAEIVRGNRPLINQGHSGAVAVRGGAEGGGGGSECLPFAGIMRTALSPSLRR